MMGALLFLLSTSWRNRLVMRVRRLKQPKYLIGAIVGLLYFLYVCFARFLFSSHSFRYRGGMAGAGDSPENLLFKESVGALILFFIVLLGWVVPHERAALVFTEAEVAFLFPAPVSRKTLIHFKLLKSQFAILFTSLLFTLIFGWSRGGAVWIRALGWWVIFSTLNLHLLAASFARTMLLDRGISNWKRRALVLGIVIVLATGIAIWTWRTVPPPPPVEEITSLSDMKYYAEKVLSSGPLVWLLYPFRVVVRPYLARTATAFLLGLWPPLLFLGLHYLWVARSDVAFEEASVEASRKVAEKVAAIRAGKQHPLSGLKKRKRSPFNLQPTGSPAVAFLWKNLISARSGFTLRFWLLLIWIAVVVGWSAAASARTAGLAAMLGPVVMAFLALSFFMGPQFVRQDFRQELPMADVLKTYPLPAWQVALGELLAPAAILTAVQWLLIALATVTLPQFGPQKLPLELRLGFAFAGVVLAPMLNLVSLVIPNSAVLLFPGWFQTGRDAPQGFEATGQRAVFAVGQLVVLILALIPAAVVFAIVFYVLVYANVLSLSIPLAAIAAALVLAVEAGFGVALVGKLFKRFDVSSETTP